MKSKKIFLALLLFCFLSQGASAQNYGFMTLEYMHVKPGDNDTYLQVERFWRKIHQQRQKDGKILAWSVWKVLAPYNSDAEYQYIVGTIYPKFSNYVDAYEKMDMDVVFRGVAADSLKSMMRKTGESRKLVRTSVFENLYDLGPEDDSHLHYALLSEMKSAPGKAQDYESFEKNEWSKIHKDLVADGLETDWVFSRLIFPSQKNYPFNYTVLSFYDNTKMMDKMDTVDWSKYEKMNPGIFKKAGELRDEVNTILLKKVVGLDEDMK